MSEFNNNLIDLFNNASFGFTGILKDFSDSRNTTGFPPYNIIKENKDKYLLELAIAGYRKEDIKVSLEDNNLIIEGIKKDRNLSTVETSYPYSIYHGISNKNFRRIFVVADNIEVKNASYVDGLLSIELVQISPEKYTKKIEIN